ncbi:MAG: hypothetical protein A2X94_15650 [Bdellovibrionales bacterium GWB1_55_8]|nr:MAG: hypothetical protein A2X94_15650 [Bdellovibrionales bacterium GWB1_55_8]
MYLDSNSGAPLSPRAVEALLSFSTDPLIPNPSSIHSHGQRAKRWMANSREQVALSLGSNDPERVLFTSSGTEANQLAIFSELEARITRGEKPHWITTSVEHESVRQMAEWAVERGVKVSFLPVDSKGLVDPAELEAMFKPETALLSLIWVNNETGVIQNLQDLAARARSRGVSLHVDGAQAWGKLPIAVNDLGCHWFCVSGHKIGAPAGIGAVWSARGTRVSPLIRGAQEKGRRGGTENLLGVKTLGAAASALDPIAWATRVEGLRDRLENAICDRIPGTRIQGKGAPRVANTTNLRFDGVVGEGLVLALDLAGYSISAGAACSSGATDPSHVLLAMGASKEEASSAIRVSLADEMPWDVLAGFIDALDAAVSRARLARRLQE